MIEGIGMQGMGMKSQLGALEPVARSPRVLYTDGAGAAVADRAQAGALPSPKAAPPIASFELTSLVADIASRPPVDDARIADLRAQIGAGSYRIDAARVADAMLVAR